MWLDSVADRRTILCVLDTPPPNGDELLRRVLTDFGLLSREREPFPDVSTVQMMQVLQRFLASLRALKARAFIVIENAQTADAPTQQEIQQLSDLAPEVLEILLVTPTPPTRLLTTRRLVTAAAALAGLAIASFWATRPPPVGNGRADAAAVSQPASNVTASSVPASPEQASPPQVHHPEGTPSFRVQVGAFSDSTRADAAMARLRQLKLPVAITVLANGLRQVVIGPYLRRADATAAREQARDAGFADSIVAEVSPSGGQALTAEDRRLLARAAALAEQHDVRALETLRSEWLDSSPTPASKSPTCAAIDAYLDAARQAQLSADRQQLLRYDGRSR